MASKEKSDPMRQHGQLRERPDAQGLAESRLHETAVRVTASRVKVLATLLGASRALTHQDLQDTFSDMDRVTLYRALDCLTEAGLAHKIAGDDRVYRYSAGTEHATPGELDSTQKASGQHQHGHFKCTRCAKVFCLDDSTGAGLLAGNVLGAPSRTSLREQLQGILQQSLGTGFQSHDIEVTIKGFCPDCKV